MPLTLCGMRIPSFFIRDAPGLWLRLGRASTPGVYIQLRERPTILLMLLECIERRRERKAVNVIRPAITGALRVPAEPMIISPPKTVSAPNNSHSPTLAAWGGAVSVLGVSAARMVSSLARLSAWAWRLSMMWPLGSSKLTGSDSMGHAGPGALAWASQGLRRHWRRSRALSPQNALRFRGRAFAFVPEKRFCSLSALPLWHRRQYHRRHRPATLIGLIHSLARPAAVAAPQHFNAARINAIFFVAWEWLCGIRHA
ncbi:hypothetical protein ACVWZT_003439 [Pseudomonas sp. TE21394]